LKQARFERDIRRAQPFKRRAHPHIRLLMPVHYSLTHEPRGSFEKVKAKPLGDQLLIQLLLLVLEGVICVLTEKMLPAFFLDEPDVDFEFFLYGVGYLVLNAFVC
jgi:hypothetical protein